MHTRVSLGLAMLEYEGALKTAEAASEQHKEA